MAGLTENVRKSLIEKLTTFANEELTKEEQLGLETIMKLAKQAATNIDGSSIFGPEDSALVQEIKNSVNDSDDEAKATTITITTTVTITASHPRIGC